MTNEQAAQPVTFVVQVPDREKFLAAMVVLGEQQGFSLTDVAQSRIDKFRKLVSEARHAKRVNDDISNDEVLALWEAVNLMEDLF